MIKKYVTGRDFESPHVVELTFEEQGDLLVAPVGHRKKTRHALGGHYFTHKSDSTLHDTHNEAIDAAIQQLYAKIKPTLNRIGELMQQRHFEHYTPNPEPPPHVAVHDLERASTRHTKFQ